MALGWVGLATPIYNIGMTYVTTELSNMSKIKKKKKTIDCKKSTVMKNTIKCWRLFEFNIINSHLLSKVVPPLGH